MLGDLFFFFFFFFFFLPPETLDKLDGLTGPPEPALGDAVGAARGGDPAPTARRPLLRPGQRGEVAL